MPSISFYRGRFALLRQCSIFRGWPDHGGHGRLYFHIHGWSEHTSHCTGTFVHLLPVRWVAEKREAALNWKRTTYGQLDCGVRLILDLLLFNVVVQVPLRPQKPQVSGATSCLSVRMCCPTCCLMRLRTTRDTQFESYWHGMTSPCVDLLQNEVSCGQMNCSSSSNAYGTTELSMNGNFAMAFLMTTWEVQSSASKVEVKRSRDACWSANTFPTTLG